MTKSLVFLAKCKEFLKILLSIVKQCSQKENSEILWVSCKPVCDLNNVFWKSVLIVSTVKVIDQILCLDDFH